MPRVIPAQQNHSPAVAGVIADEAVRAQFPGRPYWRSPDGRAQLIQGDSLEVLEALQENSIDLIFADPPYFLSNGGMTCKNGKRTKVNKGKWDKSRGAEENHKFNLRWLAACQRALTPNGTIWVSGTSHVIYSVGFAMQQLGFKMLNEIVWEKPNPPPNLSCRYFTHSTESILWAGKHRKSRHYFNYARMREINGGKQMKSVWRIKPPAKAEKAHGKHPTQKPVPLLDRIIEASAEEDYLILDPFNGSGTTGVAALARGHRYIGIERETEFLELAQKRLAEAADKHAKPGRAALHIV